MFRSGKKDSLRRKIGKVALSMSIVLPLFGAYSALPASAFTSTDADTAVNAWLTAYLNPTTHLFNTIGFWKQAEMLEVVEDAYDRTGNSTYLSDISDICAAVVGEWGTDWLNVTGLSDDPIWMSLAFIRAYHITGNSDYLTYAKNTFDSVYASAYDTQFGGGLWWAVNKTLSKNTCNNMPTAIAAVKLYDDLGDSSYLTKAESIYAWEKSTLYANGRVIGNIQADGTLSTKEFTYNQGTFIGAAHFLYKATGTSSYLQDAVAAADYTMNHMTDTNHILQYDTIDASGAGEGFKGIFVRYMDMLINQDGQSQYAAWMNHNANTAWGNRTTSNVMYSDWDNKYELSPYGGSTGVALLQDTVPSSATLPNPTPTASTVVDLSSYYNEDAWSSDANRSDFDWGDTSYAYASEQLNTAPFFEGTQYQLGPTADGQNNAIRAAGQTITIPAGKYSEIRILGTATNGMQVPVANDGYTINTFHINYNDNNGLSDYFNTILRNWRPSETTGQKIEQTMSAVHNSSGDVAGNAYMYAYYLRPLAGKTAVSLTLPNNSNIHVFAVSLVPAEQSFYDDFDDGNANGWSADLGTWNVVAASGGGYRYEGSGGSSGQAVSSAGDALWTDVAAEADVTPAATSESFNVLARYKDSSNYYQFGYVNDGHWKIRKMKSGTTSDLASVAGTVTAGQTYHLQAIVQGSTLQLYVNGVLECQATDTDFSAGKVGVKVFSGTADFDNVAVYPILLYDDFNDGNANGWSADLGTWNVVAASGGGYRYEGSGGSSGQAVSSAGDASWTDVVAAADVTPAATSESFNVLARYKDSSNYYQFGYVNDGHWKIRKMKSGSTSDLASVAGTVTAGQTYRLQAIVQGSALQLYVNGVLECQATDADFSAGKIGLKVYAGTADFDNVVAAER